MVVTVMMVLTIAPQTGPTDESAGTRSSGSIRKEESHRWRQPIVILANLFLHLEFQTAARAMSTASCRWVTQTLTQRQGEWGRLAMERAILRVSSLGPRAMNHNGWWQFRLSIS